MCAAWGAQSREIGANRLSSCRADFLFPLKRVQSLIEGGGTGLNSVTPPFAKLDLDGDGRVSFDEFQAYYAPAVPLLLKVFPTGTAGDPEPLNDALFRLLDRDNDGIACENNPGGAAATSTSDDGGSQVAATPVGRLAPFV